jgi:ribosomal protein S18 acetylase RimI-like enzyme
MDIRPFTKSDEAAVIRLWERCELTRPWNDPHRDIRRKLAVRPDLFLVGGISGEVVGSVMVGYDGHRGWINYLAVDPEFRKRGFGRLLMAEAELRLLREGCPKVNLQVRATNPEAVAFYRRLG